jgi:hypothetical protein
MRELRVLSSRVISSVMSDFSAKKITSSPAVHRRAADLSGPFDAVVLTAGAFDHSGLERVDLADTCVRF